MLFYLIVIKQNVGKPLFLVHYLQSMASSDHAVLFPLNLGFFFCNSGNSLASLGEKKKISPWCYDGVQWRETATENQPSTFYAVLPERDFCLTNGPRNCIVNVGLRPSCQDFTSFTTAEAICVFLCLEISLYYLTLQLVRKCQSYASQLFGT